MIRNAHLVRAFEGSLEKAEPVDHERNLSIVEALYEEACSLGVLPLSDPLDGIEIDVRIARAVNVPTTS